MTACGRDALAPTWKRSVRVLAERDGAPLYAAQARSCCGEPSGLEFHSVRLTVNTRVIRSIYALGSRLGVSERSSECADGGFEHG
jgi:hypothetical protein